jgi:hypothetical protein
VTCARLGRVFPTCNVRYAADSESPELSRRGRLWVQGSGKEVACGRSRRGCARSRLAVPTDDRRDSGGHDGDPPVALARPHPDQAPPARRSGSAACRPNRQGVPRGGVAPGVLPRLLVGRRFRAPARHQVPTVHEVRQATPAKRAAIAQPLWVDPRRPHRDRGPPPWMRHVPHRRSGQPRPDEQ